MSTIDEKRVYGDKTGTTELYVAAELGVAVVSISGEQVGEFALAHRCAATDVAAGGGRLAVATEEDVLLAAGDTFTGTAFGPAVAVGVDDDQVVAAGPDGRVARHVDGEWVDLGSVADVRAIEGDLLAASDGVYRLGEGLTHAGLSDVRDVAATGLPLAATGDGLYYLGNGWMDAHEGAFTVVASDGDRAHAATKGAFFEQREGGWTERTLPVAETVADVAYAGTTCVVTRVGTVLVDGETGWRTRSLGLRDVTRVAVAT